MITYGEMKLFLEVNYPKFLVKHWRDLFSEVIANQSETKVMAKEDIQIVLLTLRQPDKF